MEDKKIIALLTAPLRKWLMYCFLIALVSPVLTVWFDFWLFVKVFLTAIFFMIICFIGIKVFSTPTAVNQIKEVIEEEKQKPSKFQERLNELIEKNKK